MKFQMFCFSLGCKLLPLEGSKTAAETALQEDASAATSQHTTGCCFVLDLYIYSISLIMQVKSDGIHSILLKLPA